MQSGTLAVKDAPSPDAPKTLILVTGATGYIGGRLLTRLRDEGHSVRCMARRPENLRSRVADPEVEIVAGDVLDPSTLEVALQDVSAAYYLVHAMGASGSFERQEREGALNFARAAAKADVKRILFVGGLAPRDTELSAHMRSRHATGEALASAGVPVVELRASIVIGAGSLSYELIRALVQKLPFMVTPRWTRIKAQPIYIDDLLGYLVEGLQVPAEGHEIVEVGGSDVVSYFELMKEYARQRERTLIGLPVPFLTPGLSSLWLGLVTPIYARVGRKLIESCLTPSVITNPSAAQAFSVDPRGVVDAIRDAQEQEDSRFLDSRWSDSISSSRIPRSFGGVRFGTRLLDARSLTVPCSAAEAFAPIREIGGKRGYYYADWLWGLRGTIDLLVGGVGMRRGRRDPQHLRVGDAVDFWRVQTLEPDNCLMLRAEMRLPGRAWLRFDLEAAEGGGTNIRQTAMFDPIGLPGLLYWYSIWPLHGLIFSGMLRGIERRARQGATNGST